jgi:hypothetical protein
MRRARDDDVSAARTSDFPERTEPRERARFQDLALVEQGADRPYCRRADHNTVNTFASAALAEHDQSKIAPRTNVWATGTARNQYSDADHFRI